MQEDCTHILCRMIIFSVKVTLIKQHLHKTLHKYHHKVRVYHITNMIIIIMSQKKRLEKLRKFDQTSKSFSDLVLCIYLHRFKISEILCLLQYFLHFWYTLPLLDVVAIQSDRCDIVALSI